MMATASRHSDRGCLAVSCGAGPVRRRRPTRSAASVGLTGYAAANDRAWRDGLILAAEVINAKGGLLGKKIEIIAEDNRSEPQEAVVGYRKMMSNDKVQTLRQRLRLGRQFRRRRLRGARQDPDGAVLDPAARSPRSRNGRSACCRRRASRSRRATSTSRTRPRSARSASCTTRRPTRC